ncbi:MAG: GAF domain-containing sensor histidine kinase [Alphaproteobacteria bacterium]|nr:GAF domain-containing sensor histidine kinase [Alphaproteobacteria bacterium]
MAGAPEQDVSSLRRLVDLALELGRNQEVGKVLQSVADAVLELLDADRAFVILQGRHVVARAYGPGQSGEPSLSVAKYALAEGREVVTADISDTELSAARSVMNMQLRAVLCVPLSAKGTIIGALYADSARRGHDEMKELVGLARAYAAHASVALTNARNLAEARRRSRVAREAAHDVRNLAGSVDMGLEELEELELPEWAMQTLRDVRRMNRLAMTTATSALTEEQAEREVVDLAPLVRMGIAQQRFDARRKGVTLAEELVAAPVLALADDLARVIANLLGNALKYTPRGGTVRAVLTNDGRQAVLRVHDEGPGIPEGALDDVFRTGFQAEGAMPGHGLGLGICRTIVKRHGGFVRARNGEKGAVFEVVLPVSG